MNTLTIITPQGNNIVVDNPTDAASYITQGSDVYYPNGARAYVISSGGTIWLAPSPTATRTTLEQHFGIDTGGGGNGTGNPPAGVQGPDGRYYRLIIVSEPGRIDTGGTYPGCSLDNQGPCRAVQFTTIQEAYDYAEQSNEIPLLVGSVDEAWDIVYGRKSPGGGLSGTTLALLAGVALLLFWRKK